MKLFTVSLIIPLCIACSDAVTYVQLEEGPTSTIPLSSGGVIVYCYSVLTYKNVPAFYLDLSLNTIERDPSPDWINKYFKPKIENKQFYNSISFPNDTVAVRLFIPSADSTLIRQAFINETEIIKLIGPGDYSSGYLYPPNKELHISWDLKDSQGVRVPPGWYAFCTEFVEKDRAVVFWFKLVE